MAGQAANLRAGRGGFRMEPLGGFRWGSGYRRVGVVRSLCRIMYWNALVQSLVGLSSGLVANTRGPAAGQSKGADRLLTSVGMRSTAWMPIERCALFERSRERETATVARVSHA